MGAAGCTLPHDGQKCAFIASGELHDQHKFAPSTASAFPSGILVSVAIYQNFFSLKADSPRAVRSAILLSPKLLALAKGEIRQRERRGDDFCFFSKTTNPSCRSRRER